MSVTEIMQRIEENMRRLMAPDEVYEVRVLGIRGRGGVDSGYFNDPTEAAKAAMRYDGRCAGVYVSLNPVISDLLARGNNRIVKYAKHATRDDEVLQRRLLLLDFDPKRPAGVSSTDEEHRAALGLARACRQWLSDRGWPEPILASSGNGCHLLYGIDLPNDSASKQLVRSCLSALQVELSTDAVEIDPSVYNAGQLTKVYGTKVCKGDSTPDRPHRRSEVLEVPDQWSS